MVYVALSHVRRLSGLHLIAFDSRSVMVSHKSLCEVNRLRQLFTPHLPLYDVPVASVGDRKRTLSGSCSVGGPNPKRPRGNIDTPQCTKGRRHKRSLPIPTPPPPSKKPKGRPPKGQRVSTTNADPPPPQRNTALRL